jgi:hypothetical protein
METLRRLTQIAIITLMVTATTLVAAETSVTLRFDFQAGGEPLSIGQAFALPDSTLPYPKPDPAWQAKLTRCQFYVGNIAVRTQQGNWIELPDLTLLVDLSKPSDFPIGTLNLDAEIWEVRFGIGVGPLLNHLDPGTYPQGHPLGYQMPSMHWGWAAGYRFIVVEGMAGSAASGPVTEFQIHTVNDELYRTKTIHPQITSQNQAMVVHLPMQVEMLFHGIPVQYGIINHSSEGEAVRLTENMVDHVWMDANTSAVPENNLEAISFAPMPAHDETVLDLTALTDGSSGTYTLAISGVCGQHIATTTITQPRTAISISDLAPGLYLASIHDGNRLRAVQQLIVRK